MLKTAHHISIDQVYHIPSNELDKNVLDNM